MPDWSQVRNPDVVTAIEEHDRLGAKDFLGRYGFRRSRDSTLWHRGNEYDPRAILGAAFEHATGRSATRDDSDGEPDAVTVLTGLGFDVVVDEPPVQPARRPTAAAKKAAPATGTTPAKKAAPARKAAPAKKAAVPEPVVRLCPRCHVAVPATGVCDYCD